MNVSITVDSKALEKSLDDLGRSQLPFSTAKAINRILITSQKEQLAAMSTAFVLRRPAYAKRSIKISQFAKKNVLTGIIGVANIGAQTSVFEKFEAGGNATGKNGGRKAVPSVYVRPNKGKVIPAGKRPRNLKNSFVGDDNRSLMVRVGKGKNQRVELAYSLVNSVRIRPVLKFEQRVTKIANDQFSTVMEQELAKAIASAGLK